MISSEFTIECMICLSIAMAVAILKPKNLAPEQDSRFHKTNDTVSKSGFGFVVIKHALNKISMYDIFHKYNKINIHTLLCSQLYKKCMLFHF